MTRPILIGTPEVISMIPPEIQRMLDNEGLYIGSNPTDPSMGEAPLVSMGGKVFSMVVDNELDPTRFIEGNRLDGPFRAGREDEIKSLKFELACMKFQRDALLEMTWLDLPGDGTEEECTAEWRRIFAEGWERRAVSENDQTQP